VICFEPASVGAAATHPVGFRSENVAPVVSDVVITSTFITSSSNQNSLQKLEKTKNYPSISQ
jgi:hypothetical protein